MPTAIVAPGVDYQLTDQDVLWAARAAAFEGGNPEDVLWALTQRFAMRRQQGIHETFTDFVREFSDPIDPDLARDGSICEPGGRGSGEWYCSETALKRRDLAQSIGWDGLKSRFPEAAHAAIFWANARLRNPVPRAVNFADPKRSEAYLERNPSAVVVAKRGNWFLAEGPALSWGPDEVSLVTDSGAVASATNIYAPARVPERRSFASVFFRSLLRPYPWA